MWEEVGDGIVILNSDKGQGFVQGIVEAVEVDEIDDSFIGIFYFGNFACSCDMGEKYLK